MIGAAGTINTLTRDTFFYLQEKFRKFLQLGHILSPDKTQQVSGEWRNINQVIEIIITRCSRH